MTVSTVVLVVFDKEVLDGELERKVDNINNWTWHWKIVKYRNK